MRTPIALFLAAGLALQVVACGEDAPEASGPTAGDEVAALLGVTPPGGATDVDPGQPVRVEFAHPVPTHMAEYAALHEGDVNGPEVPGAWSLSEDGTSLVFTPDQDLAPGTFYTIHLGGAMSDVHGHMVDLEEHGFAMGGEWAREEMFDHMGSGMGPGMGMGSGFDHPHMTEGWQHGNGAYGMTFSFTTSG